MTKNLHERVIATDSALALLASLQELHGPLLLFQSGGNNDGNSPLCYTLGEFCAGSADVYLGNLQGTPFYVGHEQFEYWKHAQLIIDVADCLHPSNSLESACGKRFLTRSLLLSDDESQLQEQSNFTDSAISANRA